MKPMIGNSKIGKYGENNPDNTIYLEQLFEIRTETNKFTEIIEFTRRRNIPLTVLFRDLGPSYCDDIAEYYIDNPDKLYGDLGMEEHMGDTQYDNNTLIQEIKIIFRSVPMPPQLFELLYTFEVQQSKK